jgi:hypothetical protein
MSKVVGGGLYMQLLFFCNSAHAFSSVNITQNRLPSG